MKEILFAFARGEKRKISFYFVQREVDCLFSISDENGKYVEFFLSYDELGKLTDAVESVKR